MNKKRIGEASWDYVTPGSTLIILMFFYLGAVPVYFGVNDEMINPTNVNQSLNASAEILKDVLLDVAVTLHDVGAQRPAFWFWAWWVVFTWLIIYPIGKMIYYLFRPKEEEDHSQEGEGEGQVDSNTRGSRRGNTLSSNPSVPGIKLFGRKNK